MCTHDEFSNHVTYGMEVFDTVVYEEVNVGSRAVEETEHVSGTVRREEARMDTEGDLDLDGVSSPTGTRQP